jgi:peptidoglycan/xylan/chitin deacetylase (PgdA/CDA1 family)
MRIVMGGRATAVVGELDFRGSQMRPETIPTRRERSTGTGGERDASCARIVLTFDNLGEAAEEELGEPVARGAHYSVTQALPALLKLLDRAGLKATFFVEAINTERYPDALRRVIGHGHELGCHGWRHETFSAQTEPRKREILAASTRALRAMGGAVTGFRPPGGVLGGDDLTLLADAGLYWASPAGTVAGEVAGVACLPFRWPLIDAYFFAPPLAPLRVRDGLTSEPTAPGHFATAIARAIDGAIAGEAEAPLCVVLHPYLYTSESRLRALEELVLRLGRLRARGEAIVGPGREIAADLRARGAQLTTPVLDASSWAASVSSHQEHR